MAGRSLCFIAFSLFLMLIGTTEIKAEWPENGTPVCTDLLVQRYPQITTDGAGGAIITWIDYRCGHPNSDIYARRIAANGNPLWAIDGVPICADPSQQFGQRLMSDGSGGAIIIWNDERNGGRVYAQRINADGDTLWAKDGVPVCTAGNDQAHPKIMPDGIGGAIIVWRRNAVGDIFAQRIDSNGAAVWTEDGIPIALVSNDQQYPQIVPDGGGGAIITWQDDRYWADDIYAQRVDANGDTLCPANGVPICAAASIQQDPQITSDGAGGAIVTWYDGRNGNDDIYAAKIPECVPIATLLQGFNVSPHALDITLEWTLSEAEPGIDFHVLRAEAPAGAFCEMTDLGILNDGLAFSVTDKDIEPGSAYRYRVDISDESGRRVLFETNQITVPAPSLALHQNHPNPFNPVTTIGYNLPSAVHVTLEIYDVSGRRIALLANEMQEGGAHAIEWAGLDEKGNQASSGTYIYRLKAGKEVISRKMVLLR